MARGEIVPVGPEFQVNSYTTNDQGYPSVSAAPDGKFVVSWESYGQDGSDFGVFARCFDSDGTPQSGEFLVSTYTIDVQRTPFVAVTGSGFVIVWRSNRDGDRGGIFGKRYQSDGMPIGSEFQVNTYTTERQLLPRIAALPSQEFLVAWHSEAQDGDGRGIFAQLYGSDGMKSNGEFQVNTYTTDNQEFPFVAAANGQFIVAWHSKNQDGFNEGIYARRFAADGTSLGTEFRVNTRVRRAQERPWIGTATGGDFVVGWQSNRQDGDGRGIFAQRYAANETAQGVEFQVNTYTTGGQTSAAVATKGDGTFLFAWRSESPGGDGSGDGVFGQLFDSGGGAQGVEFQVNSYTTNDQSLPAIASFANGFVAAWRSRNQDGSGLGVFAQVYAEPTDTPTETPTQTPTETPTVTPTSTPTSTPTPTPQPDGSSCESDSQCISANCVDGVCCNTPCDGASEFCLPDGVCRDFAAPAPAASPRMLALSVLMLLALAALALRRIRA